MKYRMEQLGIKRISKEEEGVIKERASVPANDQVGSKIQGTTTSERRMILCDWDYN